MAKYYLVNLFDVKYEYPYRGQAIPLDYVIVCKGLFSTHELLTDYKIDVLPKRAVKTFGVIDPAYHDKDQAEKTGYHLAVEEEDLTEKNLATIGDIQRYVDGYEYSRYKEAYESIKEKTGSQQQATIPTVKQMVKVYRGTEK